MFFKIKTFFEIFKIFEIFKKFMKFLKSLRFLKFLKFFEIFFEMKKNLNFEIFGNFWAIGLLNIKFITACMDF